MISATLLSSARSLLEADDACEILSRYCADVTEKVPNLVLAWAWFGDPATNVVQPQVIAGPASEYAANLCIVRNRLTEMGPAYKAIAGERVDSYGISPLSLFGPWRDAVSTYAIRSVLAMPLKSTVDEQRGVLVLYAHPENYFKHVGEDVFYALSDLFSAVLSRSAKQEALRKAAFFDKLTGLLNRHAAPGLARRMERTGPDSPESALILFDLDHFKSVNDTYGHDTGDVVLGNVGRLLKEHVRMADATLRWGGEEFLVGLPGIGTQDALRIAQSLRARIQAEQHLFSDGQLRCVTASIGVASLCMGETFNGAVRRADEALYASKKAGRNRVTFAESPQQLLASMSSPVEQASA